MPEPKEIASPAWKKYETEPRYPTNNLAYIIDTTQAPTEGSKDGQYVVSVVQGAPLLLWKGTFVALCDILRAVEYKTTKVVFNRPPNGITTVRKV